MTARRRTGRSLERAGIDITCNVNFRMVTPEERALFAAGGAVISDHIEEEISSRLPASLRDEAIWQYHVSRQRGLVFWCADQSFRYISEHDWRKCSSRTAQFTPDEIDEMLKLYDPTREVLVVIDYPDSVGLARIGNDGRLNVVRRESPPSRPYLVSRSENES